MSREIKFRAWHKEKKKMVSGSLIFWFKAVAESGKGESVFNACEWMQYTGLKDKNGKEIYEGDILSPNKREVLWKSNSRIGTVFNCAGWYTRSHKTDFTIPETLGCFTFGITQAEASEVIGNIYENPELINH